MALKQVGAEEAKRLVQDKIVYLDVRTVPEFEAGHVPGAYNIPLLHAGPGGMQPNPQFEREVRAAFPTEVPLLVGCKAGTRSARAATLLQNLGYETIYDFVGGWSGNGTDPGWVAAGGATATAAEPGHAYKDLEGARTS